MQRFYKTCCCFGQNPKRKGIISLSNFDGKLSNILFACVFLKLDRDGERGKKALGMGNGSVNILRWIRTGISLIQENQFIF